jgi:hypothetical protein
MENSNNSLKSKWSQSVHNPITPFKESFSNVKMQLTLFELTPEEREIAIKKDSHRDKFSNPSRSFKSNLFKSDEKVLGRKRDRLLESVEDEYELINKRKKEFKKRYKQYKIDKSASKDDLFNLLDRPIDNNTEFPYRYTIKWLYSYANKHYDNDDLFRLIQYLEDLEYIHECSKRKDIQRYVININTNGEGEIANWNGSKMTEKYTYSNRSNK